MTARAARALRGAAFAATAVLLAAVAHTLAGGGAPSPLFCAVVAVIATPVAMLVAGSRPSVWRTAAAVVASQAAFHVAFTLVGDIGRWDASAAAHAHHGDMLLAPAATSAAQVMTLGMLAAHAVAAIVSAALVLRGERAVVTIGRWVRARLIRSVAPVPAVPARPVPRLRSTSFVVHPRVAAAPLSRRGPPVLLAA